jgi:hypothetical protein
MPEASSEAMKYRSGENEKAHGRKDFQGEWAHKIAPRGITPPAKKFLKSKSKIFKFWV